MPPIGFQVTVDAHDPHAQARFWAAALGYVVEDGDAFIRDLLVQGHVGRDRLDAEVARLVALGATEQYRIDEPGSFHVTLADPEGNEFCLQ